MLHFLLHFFLLMDAILINYVNQNKIHVINVLEIG